MDSILLSLILISQVVISFASSGDSINNGSSSSSSSSSPLPVVLWHGMGDTCCDPLSLGSVIKLIENQVPSIYVKSLRIGNNVETDFSNGYFMNVNDQISLACSLIKSDDKLTNGFNLMGFSQGGQFSRALVQRCSLPVRNLITLGAQHQGVYGLPRCTADTDNGLYSSVCDLVRKLLSMGAYNSFVQKRLVQAQYWHDPLKESKYKEKSLFLADINNENSSKNETYRSNLVNLNKFVMIMFANDTMVIPKESGHFGYYQPGTNDKIVPMEDSPLYTDDRLGLKELNDSGKLIKFTVPGDHCHIKDDWFINQVINPYLR
ncbi:palmitoyl-protein thioesterase 1-like [Panonychus citri]|uniref:palmitoyl-protein thioesterase 1-like n=1 Tax=Panonychus citri TaxID=50023 RepID=UPI002307FF16|nr:palmitoyl-protein thioesterase 1-like [Panonychus citri]